MLSEIRIDIVIVNWNSGRQLQRCVESIRNHGAGHVDRIVVVDNGSVDDSADFLGGAVDVVLVPAGRNLGFGRACNLGAAHGQSDFVLFLNPDACLMPASLDAALEYFGHSGSERIGIVGISLLGDDGEIQRTCARFPSAWQMIAKSIGIAALIPRSDYHMTSWDHAETRRVDHVMGAFYLVRRSLFEQLQGFDERYFVYLEDLDFSRRAAEAGYGSIYLAEAQAYHRGGGISEQVKANRLFYALRSRIQYVFKHFNRPAALAVGFATLFVEPLSRLALLMVRHRFSEIGDLRRSYTSLWSWLVRREAPLS